MGEGSDAPGGPSRSPMTVVDVAALPEKDLRSMITVGIAATIFGVLAGGVGFNRVAFTSLGVGALAFCMRFLP
jgi:hypothetical protein